MSINQFLKDKWSFYQERYNSGLERLKIILGDHVKDPLLASFIGIGFAGLMSFFIYRLAGKMGAFPLGIIIFLLFFVLLFKIGSIMILLSFFSMKKSDFNEYCSLITSVTLVEIILLVIFNFNLKMPEVNLPNFTPYVFLVGTIIIWLFFRNKSQDFEILQKDNGGFLLKTLFFTLILLLLNLGFILSLDAHQSLAPFYILDILIFVSLISFIAENWKRAGRLNKLKIDLTSSSKVLSGLENGSFVTLEGKFSKTIICKENHKTFNLSFDEYIPFYNLTCKKNTYKVYAKDFFKNGTSNNRKTIFPGSKLRVWGKVIHLEKNGKDLSAIYPFRIFLLK